MAKRTVARQGRAARTADTDPLSHLRDLACNLSWVWNPSVRRTFESVDPVLWEATNHNPIATLAQLDPDRRAALTQDSDLSSAVDDAARQLRDYLKTPSWFDRTAKGRDKRMRIAYFCMEYGIHECLPLYSGGLGILAGDHLKSASDLGIPLVAIGVLWRRGYYRQEVRRDGSVRIVYPQTDFSTLPIVDTGKKITVPIGASKVRARIWKAQVGRIALYLLDTDVPANSPSDRKLTRHLYGGTTKDYRIRQEILLGIGGLLALDALNIKPTVFHLNEGHAAFCPLERVRRLVASGTSLSKAIERVRQSSVFTTHTPVSAGNDRFTPALVTKYLAKMPKALGQSEADFLALGREDPDDRREPFCMTVLALKLARHCNAVAELHGHTSRAMWMRVYGAKRPADVPIGHVTNGVHPQSWIADEAMPLYDRYLKPKWNGAGPDDDWWTRVPRIPPEELWSLRQALRRKMITDLRRRAHQQIVAKHAGIEQFAELYDTLDEDALTIGFARRFALYKRAPLIFRDAKRLAAILNNADRPVQLIFAGKAHPLDQDGNDYVQRIYEYSRRKPFRGRVYLIENYDIAVGRLLTQGCDVWLNNPIRPMEASGTSGMKPPLNAGLNCSIMDGWWPEAYTPRNGWRIGGQQFDSRAKQDAFDAEAIYETLENKIVPAFYTRNRQGVPLRWTKLMAESMRSIPAFFSSHRMVAQYTQEYYLAAHR